MKPSKMGYKNKAKSSAGVGGAGPQGPQGPAGNGFTLSASGNYDIQSKKLENVSAATNANDAVVMQQMASKVDKVMTDHLDANFKEIKNVSRGTDNDAFPLFHGKSIFLTSNGQKFDAKKQEIINVTTNITDNSSAVNMAVLNQKISSAGGSGITKNIDLQEKYNVLNSKQRNLNELKTHYDSLVSFEEVKQNFLSRVETFSMGTSLDMNHNAILNLKDPKLGKEPATKDYADKKLALTGGRMTGSVNMGNHEITNLATPTGNSNAATKSYVDTEDAKLLPKAGGTMTGAINMGNSKITNLGTPTANKDAATKAYSDANLPKAGGTMTGEINMGTSKITNLAEPSANSDAATKQFVEKSHISQSGMPRNMFLYQMQDVLESSSESNIKVYGIMRFPNTPHTLFKNAYNFTIGKSSSNEYNARIGFNFNPVHTGPYTYVVEYFPPTMTNVSVDCRSTPLNVNKQIFQKFPTYVKNIVQIHKWQMTQPDYLMVDIKSTGDASSPAVGTGWMIVYGIEGTHNDVSSSVLDTPFLIRNGSMIMQVPLDMGDFVLRNLSLPTQATQAASKEFVEQSIWNETHLANFVDGFIRNNSECFYSIDRGGNDEVSLDSSAIKTLFDKSLSGTNATEATSKFAPKLSTTKNKRRYFMTFSGTQRLLSLANLNPAAGTANIVNVFILFQLSSHAGPHSNFRNALFSNYAAGWSRLVCFAGNTNNLIIGGTTKDGSEVHGGDNTQVTSAQWQSKANASELNKWCCLSVHWDVPGGSGKSSCWVNGKKLKSFQAKSSIGSDKMTLGDLMPTGMAGLNGKIQLFLLYEGQQMSNFMIKAHHKMICERYGVDHDAISFP